MRRRAYLVFSDTNNIKINTSFKVQQAFDIKAIPEHGGIDLIALKIVDNVSGLPFYARPYGAGYDDHWDLHDRKLATKEDFDKIEKAPHTLIVFGLVDAYGTKEPIGFITRAETKSFEVYVP